MKVQDGQCIVDAALVLTGSVEGIVALASRNGLSPSQSLSPGSDLVVLPEDVVDSNVLNRYAVQEINPATEILQGA